MNISFNFGADFCCQLGPLQASFSTCDQPDIWLLWLKKKPHYLFTCWQARCGDTGRYHNFISICLSTLESSLPVFCRCYPCHRCLPRSHTDTATQISVADHWNSCCDSPVHQVSPSSLPKWPLGCTGFPFYHTGWPVNGIFSLKQNSRPAVLVSGVV